MPCLLLLLNHLFIVNREMQCDQEAWFAPDKAAVGPAARAFHAATAIGRKM